MAISNYNNPNNPDELTLKKGDILTIFHENCDGPWSQAKNATGEYGSIHSSCFEKLEDAKSKLN